MKILVTGASGFVGQSLIKELKQRGVSTVSIGRQLLTSNSDSHVSVPDYTAQGIWQKPLLGRDVVIHLAARVHVMQDVSENPLEAFLAVNLHGTVNLAVAAANAKVKRFVYVSSIKVNGEYTTKQSFTEQDTPNPQDPYAISKWQAEQALRKIEKETGMEVVILRPPLIYGAGVKANFASLLKLVDKGLPLPLLSINNKRSLIYLGNFVDAIITCTQHPNAAGQTYLVSDGEDVSMVRLVKKIALSLNRPSYLFPFPIMLMRLLATLTGKTASLDRLTQSLVIDSSKIRKELNWKPPFTMAQGLKVTADWYRKFSDIKDV
ncbi:MAG TPA: SDR family oxidoreductase [Methylotenera sp.]|nr:SDR family oxidoreductase [Methylotenera sp.]